MGNLQILILKKKSFVPKAFHSQWSKPSDDYTSGSWRSDLKSQPTSVVDKAASELEQKMIAQAALLKGRAMVTNHDGFIQEMLFFINKVSPSNQHITLPQAAEMLKTHLQHQDKSNHSAYFDSVVDRLISKIKNAKLIPELVARLCKCLVSVNVNLADRFIAKVQELADNLHAGCEDPEEFMKIYVHSDSFARFIIQARIIKLFPGDFTKNMIDRFFDVSSTRPDFILAIADVLIKTKTVPALLGAIIQHMKEVVSSVKESRSRCLMLNLIEQHGKAV